MKTGDKRDQKKPEELDRRSFWERWGLPGFFELGQLGLGWVLISFAITFGFFVRNPQVINQFFQTLNLSVIPVDVFAMVIALGLAFMPHEMAHKFAAQKYGGRAEFRLTPSGILITLVSTFLGFPLITPGAVFWSREEGLGLGIRGRVSASGPISNLLMASLFLLFLWLPYPFNLIAQYGVFLNLIIGAFNMLPILMLDGSKVIAWDPQVWIAIMGLLVTLFFFAFIGPFLALIFSELNSFFILSFFSR